MEQKEYFGKGSIKNLKNILRYENPESIFLVTGRNSYEISGAREKIKHSINSYNKDQFSEFAPTFEISDIKKGIELFNKNKYDLIIAIGGGSVIDMAKSINALSNKENLEEAVRKNHTDKLAPLVAIPTTSGSGSEATHFAVVYHRGIKYSIASPELLPDYAIIDPLLTLTMSKNIAASSGIDVLGQAIESYWNINSTKESKEYSKEAIRLVMQNLEESVERCTPSSRFNMAKAANLAGKAINLTKTTAPHAISYPFTSRFKIPHGHAVGLTLGEILIYNSNVTQEDCLDKRGYKYVQKTIQEIAELLGEECVESARIKINLLMKNCGLETKLPRLGIKNTELIIKEGFNPERVKNNPRELTEENLRGILEKIS